MGGGTRSRLNLLRIGARPPLRSLANRIVQTLKQNRRLLSSKRRFSPKFLILRAEMDNEWCYSGERFL